MNISVPHKKTASALAIILAITFLQTARLLAQDASPVGVWETYDNKTKKPSSHIRITEENGKLYGKVEKVFKEPGQDQNPKCTKCSGDKKDQPVIGMTILWDLKKDGAGWSGGQIMDPDEGKTYKCKMEIADGGKTLKVRGFMGFSLIGRTESWQRIE